MSVLGKLIQKELGKEKYQQYCNTLSQKKATDVFCDIYLSLCERDSTELNVMLLRLLDTVKISVSIGKRFLYMVLLYGFIMGCLYFLLPANLIMIVAMAVATVCIGYKTYEFLANRYCDKDVRMVLIYKSVLFHLLENEEKASR